MYQSKSQKYSHKALKISKFDIALQTEYEKKKTKKALNNLHKMQVQFNTAGTRSTANAFNRS